MMPTLEVFLTLDLAPMLTATCCAISCALVGNFLLLRKQALLGDAIAHSVLPGLAAAFLITGSRDSLPMFVGALVAGVFSAVSADGLKRAVKIDPGAAMGVVFSAMFAAGIVLMSLPHMRAVDLDADCVLSGTLESIVWLGNPSQGTSAPTSLVSLLQPAVWLSAPRQLVTSISICLMVLMLVVLFFKELRLTSFDPGLAAALGFKPGWMATLLVFMAAASSVASFEAVGSILVIAMLICPAATARLLTDRLKTQVVLSVGIAILTTVLGYMLAGFGPGLLGVQGSALSASGMIATMGGVLLVAALVCSPSHGLVAAAFRARAVTDTIVREDLLAMLYRYHEAAPPGSEPMSIQQVRRGMHVGGASPRATARALRALLADGRLSSDSARSLRLTPQGEASARALVRTHRLWELYLVQELGLRPDHVHRTAMQLEHHTSPDMHADLVSVLQPDKIQKDPHGREIP